MDHHCTGTKGEHLIFCVQQATDPAISPRRGVQPRSPEGSGALPKFKECLAMYSRKARTRELEEVELWTQTLLARDELNGWSGLRP